MPASEVSVSELRQQGPCGAEAPDLSSSTRLCGGSGSISISSKCAAAAPGISSSSRLPEAQSATPAAAAHMYAAVPSGRQQQKLQEGQQLEVVADTGVTAQARQEVISAMAGADKVSHPQCQQQQRQQQDEQQQQQQQLPGRDSRAELPPVSAVAGAASTAAHLVQGSSNDSNDLPKLLQPPGFSSSSSGGSSGRPSDDSAAGACPSISTENAGSTNSTSAAMTKAPGAGADVGSAVAAGGSRRSFEEVKQLWQGHMHVQQAQEGDVDDQVSSGEELDGLGELGSSDNEGERCLQV